MTRPQLQPHFNVFNISQHHLTPDQISLLAKGLTFCPSQRDFDHVTFYSDVEQFLRRIKLHDYFTNRSQDSESSDSDIEIISSNTCSPYTLCLKPPSAFKTSNTWEPRDDLLSEPIIALIQLLQEKLLSCHTPPYLKTNLTKGEKLALKNLMSNRDILVRPADKGGATVVLDFQQYDFEICRQLQDTEFYSELQQDPLLITQQKIKSLIGSYLKSGLIHPESAEWLIEPEPRIANFYILPKIHKSIQLINNQPTLTSMVKGRPILSANQCPTERLSAFVDIWLQPIMTNLPTFIKDTGHLIQTLKNWSPPDPTKQYYIASFDVVSLYTQIPNEQGLRAVKEALQAKYDNRQAHIITKLTEAVLINNIFQYNGRFFKQIRGCAMGSRCSPAYACIMMGTRS